MIADFYSYPPPGGFGPPDGGFGYAPNGGYFPPGPGGFPPNGLGGFPPNGPGVLPPQPFSGEGFAPQQYDPSQQFNPQQYSPYYPAVAPTNNFGYEQPIKLATVGQRSENKRALLIGINYIGTPNALSGCIPDVHKMKQYLNSAGFMDNNILILTDDQQDPIKKPTKMNMLNSFNWLLGGAKPGDSLFFHFSGHGSQTKDLDGDEEDGLDETILPVDFKTAGQIIDDQIHDFLVKPLPYGARLTALMDCCHSGTGMDLPFIYGGTRDANEILAPSYKGMKQNVDYFAANRGKQSVGDVVCFSGCQDNQTSADSTQRIQGMLQSGGAMTTAFVKCLQENPGGMSYAQFLLALRAHLKNYSQVAQLSTGRPMDMNQPYYV